MRVRLHHGRTAGWRGIRDPYPCFVDVHHTDNCLSLVQLEEGQDTQRFLRALVQVGVVWYNFRTYYWWCGVWGVGWRVGWWVECGCVRYALTRRALLPSASSVYQKKQTRTTQISTEKSARAALFVVSLRVLLLYIVCSNCQGWWFCFPRKKSPKKG